MSEEHRFVTAFEEADARLGGMHGYEPIRVAVFSRSIPVTREGLAVMERWQQETAKRRWKARYRMERLLRRIWDA